MGKEAVMVALVFLGGGFGSVGRFLMSGAVQRLSGGSFPWGTFSVNALGALIIGALWAWAERYDAAPAARVFFGMGILGGFTTFSAFSFETFALLRDGAWRLGLLNIVLSNLVCLLAAACGFFVLRAVLR
jgi:CrcB protein